MVQNVYLIRHIGYFNFWFTLYTHLDAFATNYEWYENQRSFKLDEIDWVNRTHLPSIHVTAELLTVHRTNDLNTQSNYTHLITLYWFGFAATSTIFSYICFSISVYLFNAVGIFGCQCFRPDVEFINALINENSRCAQNRNTVFWFVSGIYYYFCQLRCLSNALLLSRTLRDKQNGAPG